MDKEMEGERIERGGEWWRRMQYLKNQTPDIKHYRLQTNGPLDYLNTKWIKTLVNNLLSLLGLASV